MSFAFLGLLMVFTWAEESMFLLSESLLLFGVTVSLLRYVGVGSALLRLRSLRLTVERLGI